MAKRYTDEFLGTMGMRILLVKLSLPAMIVNALYNVVDTIYLGRGVGPLAIGGLPIGVGASSLISSNIGSGNRERVYHAAGTALNISVLFGLLMTIDGVLFLDQILFSVMRVLICL